MVDLRIMLSASKAKQGLDGHEVLDSKLKIMWKDENLSFNREANVTINNLPGDYTTEVYFGLFYSH